MTEMPCGPTGDEMFCACGCGGDDSRCPVWIESAHALREVPDSHTCCHVFPFRGVRND